MARNQDDEVYIPDSTVPLTTQIAGAGTVTSVSSANANLTVSNPTTTPNLTVVAAPKLNPGRTINGVAFDGTTNITVPVSGTVPVANGGTGITSYTIGDILYASASGTLSTLADVAAGSYLRSGGVTTAPVWSTLVLPNSATTNRIPYATGTNTWGESANFAFDGIRLALKSNGTTTLCFLGSAAGNGTLTGTHNTGVGSFALASLTSGSGNTAVGYNAGGAITIGASNVALGRIALQSNTSGTNNMAIGYAALNSNVDGLNNVGIGLNAVYSNVSGNENLGIGTQALASITGNSNTGIGFQSMKDIGAGNQNSAFGAYSGYTNTTGSLNVFIGFQAGYSETGSQRLYISNSSTATPLVYGEFDNKLFRVYGRMGALATTEQCRLEYDATHYFSVTVASTGSTTFALTGTSPTFTFSQGVTFSASVTMADAQNVILNTTTGTKFGTATSQKLAFYNSTPIVQPTTGVATSTFVANTSGIVDDSATFGGYKLSQIVSALKNLGLLA